MTARKNSDPAIVPPMHEGPLGPYIELFAQRLREQQFSPKSARAQILQALKLSRWLRTRKLGVGDFDADAIDAHCAQQRRGLSLRRGHHAALQRLLGILREQGVCREDVPRVELSPRQRVEESFKRASR